MARVVLMSLLFCAACMPAAALQSAGRSAFTPRGETTAAERPEWEIVFPADISDDEYARQLDHFGIEIAAISKPGKIEIISGLTQSKPARRTTATGSEHRLWIGWKSGTLNAVDRRLLRKAGIGSQDKQLVHYLSPSLQKQLEILEERYAGRTRRDIRRTQFAIRAKPDAPGYEFVVVEQDPPKPPPDGAQATDSGTPRAP
jgi:hypothetical protein